MTRRIQARDASQQRSRDVRFKPPFTLSIWLSAQVLRGLLSRIGP